MTAYPLSKDEIIIRQQLVITHSSDRIAGARRNVYRFESRTVLGYAPAPTIAFFAIVPLVHISRDLADTSDVKFGLGDAALFARYEVFRSDQAGRTFRVAPFLGLRVPTGKEGKTGDGSVDLFGGVIATLASTKWVLDSQIRYDLNRKANAFERGDVATFETSFQYRLSPRQLTRETEGFVYAVLEASANHYERNQVGRMSDPNSGGFQLYLTPGLQYAKRRWIADVGVSIPVVSNLKGTALEPDYSILTSIRVNF